MKRRILGGMLAAMLIVITACGAKEGQKEDQKEEAVTKDSGPEQILEEANRQYGKQKLRGTDCVYTYYYSDGSTEEETGATVFDVEKGMQELVYKKGDTVLSQEFNVKDGDTYYSYAYDSDRDSWIRYRQVPDDNGKTVYEDQEDGDIFVFDEAYGYNNVKYSKEEEEIDGKKTIKITVTADEAVGRDEEDEEMTREDVLSNYGLTEEAVGYIEGLSEELDQYVDAINQAAYGSTTSFENYIWVDAESFMPVKYEANTAFQETETVDEAGEDPLEAFENHYWKAVMVQDDMDNGMSLSEALEDVKNSEASMQEQQEDPEEDGTEEEDAGEDSAEQVSMKSVETYVYGEDCMKLDELPKEFEEITEDDYMYGEY